MKKFLVYFVIFFVSIFLGNLIANQIFDAIIPHNETLYTTDETETPITALKERCSSCFEGYECIDDFLNVIDTEMVFAVYYRQYEDGETNTFLLIPNKEAEEPWMSYLHQIKDGTAKHEDLWQFTFSLAEDVIWVSGGDPREA